MNILEWENTATENKKLQQTGSTIDWSGQKKDSVNWEKAQQKLPSEQEREKVLVKRASEACATITRAYIHVIRLPERKEKESKARNILTK